jgi:energy-converting hydrogenase A subunit M
MAQEVQVDAFRLDLASIEGVHAVVEPAGEGHLERRHIVIILSYLGYKPRS